MSIYTCPICGKDVEYAGRLPAIYPFCSARCKWVDLGRWFQGEYRIDRDLSDEDVPGGVSPDAPNSLDDR